MPELWQLRSPRIAPARLVIERPWSSSAGYKVFGVLAGGLVLAGVGLLLLCAARGSGLGMLLSAGALLTGALTGWRVAWQWHDDREYEFAEALKGGRSDG